MINIFVPIIDEVDKYQEFLSKINKRNVKVFVGVHENLADKLKFSSKSVVVTKYENSAKKEEILNELSSQKIENGKILVVRRPLDEEEYQSLITSDCDIAVLKQKRNKFVQFLKNLKAKILQKIFSFSYFEDISAVCFSENLFDLICQCNNLSMASRINRYVGVSIDEIETAHKAVKKETNKTKNGLMLFGVTMFLLASIASVVCINLFTKPHPIAIMFEILWLIVALTTWLIGLINFSRAVAVGDLRFGRAVEVNKK